MAKNPRTWAACRPRGQLNEGLWFSWVFPFSQVRTNQSVIGRASNEEAFKISTLLLEDDIYSGLAKGGAFIVLRSRSDMATVLPVAPLIAI